LYLKFTSSHVLFWLLLLREWAFAHFFFSPDIFYSQNIRTGRTVVPDGNEQQSLKIQIMELAEKTASSMKMEVVLAEIKNEGGRAIIRVYLDKQTGITLEDCERFSKRFSATLDVEDFIPFTYVLEVSSPGVNRPLVKEADFRRFLGENARVRTSHPIEGQRNFKGRIVNVTEGRVTFESAPDKQVVIAAADIEKASLIADIRIGKCKA
jgi:ribosome maturation factor RimP